MFRDRVVWLVASRLPTIFFLPQARRRVTGTWFGKGRQAMPLREPSPAALTGG
jgi:hypothetical protein